MSKRVLVIGFGNAFRHDDGVASVIVNELRGRLGRPPLDSLDDGFDDLGHAVDTVLLHQIVPELAESLEGYQLVIFVDAHVPDVSEPLREEWLEAAHRTPFVYHQTHPATVLDLAKRMYGKAPEGVLLSVRGHDFDFGEGLSPETAALVSPAVERILALAGHGVAGQA